MAETGGSAPAPSESGGAQRGSGASPAAASPPAALRGDALAGEARWLRSSGIIQAYEYVLLRLARQGRPQGNVLEYAADEIENFGRQWSSHLRGIATPRLPVKAVSGWTFLSDTPSVISPGKRRLAPVRSPSTHRTLAVDTKRARGSEGAPASAPGETVPAGTTSAAGSQSQAPDTSMSWITEDMGSQPPSAPSSAVHSAGDPAPGRPARQPVTGPSRQGTSAAFSPYDQSDAEGMVAGGGSAGQGHEAEGSTLDTACRKGDADARTAAAAYAGDEGSSSEASGLAGGAGSQDTGQEGGGFGSIKGGAEVDDGGAGDLSPGSEASSVPEAMAQTGGDGGADQVKHEVNQGGVDNQSRPDGVEAEARGDGSDCGIQTEVASLGKGEALVSDSSGHVIEEVVSQDGAVDKDGGGGKAEPALAVARESRGASKEGHGSAEEEDEAGGDRDAGEVERARNDGGDADEGGHVDDPAGGGGGDEETPDWDRGGASRASDDREGEAEVDCHEAEDLRSAGDTGGYDEAEGGGGGVKEAQDADGGGGAPHGDSGEEEAADGGAGKGEAAAGAGGLGSDEGAERADDAEGGGGGVEEAQDADGGGGAPHGDSGEEEAADGGAGKGEAAVGAGGLGSDEGAERADDAEG